MTDQISALLDSIEIPSVHKVRQSFADCTLDQPAAFLRDQLAARFPIEGLAGQRVAIT